jgi:SAM-dependent methyltransferase
MGLAADVKKTRLQVELEPARCRHCQAPLRLVLADLGASPVANDYLDPAELGRMEPFYPLQVLVCSSCRLAQTRDVLGGEEIFRADYAYFSSHSTSWLAHAQAYVGEMARRFALGPATRWVELASNDGYLLQYALRTGAPCLGIEPCQSVADAAIARGVDTRVAFFGVALARQLAAEGLVADFVTANNVLAHVPDINDFVAGLAVLLKPEGAATLEVQHLLRLMQHNEFDTIYFEHFSYLSLLAATRIFEAAGLRVFDVEELPSHGGSIRFFVCHKAASHAEHASVARVRAAELAYGLGEDGVYQAWAARVRKTKRALLELLIGLKEAGKSIAAYGAPAKGVTLLNYCGVGRDFIDFTVDRAPSKQGRLMPGVHLPILDPEAIFLHKPDYLLILPWNLEAEIKAQMAGIRAWGGKFILPIPAPRIDD